MKYNLQIRNAIMDKNSLMFLLPTKRIIDAIIHNSDDDINRLPLEIKTYFLEGKGVAIENKMVSDYIDGTLDSKNSKVISMCEVRVSQKQINI